MLLEFDRPAAAFVGLLLVLLYSFSQLSVLQIEATGCQQRRLRITDIFTLVLFYFAIMFLRSLTIEKMMFRYDLESTELTTALVFGGAIITVFLLCRVSRAKHIFYESDPETSTNLSVSRMQRLLQTIFTVIALILVVAELVSHSQNLPIKGGLANYLRWFVLPRIAFLVLWVLVSIVLPVHGGQGKFAIRSYGLAVVFALCYVQPTITSILPLAIMLGLLTHELSVFGAAPIYGGYTAYKETGVPYEKYEYVCPYNTVQEIENAAQTPAP